MAKKFGTFGGVFTPSILTILGVIMYMRLGWVVGNAGLYGTIIIILIAHIISVSTGLSISSIATDKKVGAGGVYYVLSRSLGLPIGGAIGVTLFVGTALSIALYLVGFAESFNAYIGVDTSVNGLRLGGTIALMCLAAIALISTAVAIKTQYFIMAAIVISLVSIFAGSWSYAPEQVQFFGNENSVPLETVFAIFFPAVTGFTAGIAMSGDLADPKKSIPAGTIAAIIVGFCVYIVVAIFIAYAINPQLLQSDYNVLMKIALFAPAVAAGIWGATLSSALGGILGGPRILQAMSVDKITPKIFARGVGKDREPRNALFITLLIAQCGILIGELDLIARVVSMFYLAAYGFINLSFFLESWASADFSPSFKVKRWVGLVGFVATFAVMFKLDMLAMFAAFIVIGSIYLYLQRKQLALGSGDIWHSVWSSLVLTGLKRMDKSEDVKRNWKPNILLFSGSTETRPHLIEIAQGIAGKVGMISNFHLIENPDATVLFPKHKQSLQDPFLIENGIFGRQQEVKNVYEGIEMIASTYGFSGVEPNTVLLGWAKNTKDPLMFAQMTQKLIELDYNVLYLDYDWNKKFGKYQHIDIWWLNLRNNAELTLNIAKFISVSPHWQKAKIRLILINNTNKEGFERKIHQRLDTYRIDATVKVINNFSEGRSSFELMKNNSQEADLIIAGIPDIAPGEEKDFVDNTTEMFSILGTTLLVKTSSILGEDESDLAFDTEENGVPALSNAKNQLVPLPVSEDKNLQKIVELVTQEIENQSVEAFEMEIASLENMHQALISQCRKEAIDFINQRFVDTDNSLSQEDIKEIQILILDIYQKNIDHFKKEDLEYLQERMEKLYKKYTSLPARIKTEAPKIAYYQDRKIRVAKVLKQHFDTDYQNSLHTILHLIGNVGYEINDLIRSSLVTSIQFDPGISPSAISYATQINESFDAAFQKARNKYRLLGDSLRNSGRASVNDLLQKMEAPKATVAVVKRSHKDQLKIKNDENANFANYWYRNQLCFTNQLATDITLKQIHLKIELTGKNIKEEVNRAMFETSRLRLIEAEKWLESLEQNSIHQASDLPDVNHGLTYDDHKIEEILIQTESFGNSLSDQLLLIDPDSMRKFSSVLGVEVSRIVVNAQATYGYLIHQNLKRPLQKHLLSTHQACMEVLSRVQYDLHILMQTLNQLTTSVTPTGWSQLTSNAKKHLNELRTSLSQKTQVQDDALTDIVQNAISSLNTSSIMDHAVRVLPNMVAPKKGIIKWIGNTSDKAGALAHRYGNLLKSQNVILPGTQRDLLQRREQRNDMHYELKQFVENLEINDEIADKLPFYYKQLFIGKSSPSVDQMHFRETELNQALNMLLSSNKEEHSIIVLGEPLSGKSYFAEAVVKKIGPGGTHLIKVQPPVNGSTEVIEFVKVLKKQIKSTSKSLSIIKEVPPKTIFLLEDLELWWDRSDVKGKLIRSIVDTINEYKSKHSFILNCNIYAFNIMQSQGHLDDLTASRIFLRRFDIEALRNLLLKKHDEGGLRLTLKGEDQDEISRKNLRKLMYRFQQSSQGIVGIALHQWISNIQDFREEQVEIDFPQTYALPHLEDKQWLIILSQFIIHKHLDAGRLQNLFGYENRAQAERIISQLRADGIIQDIMGSSYKINPLVLIWIIKKAEEFKLL